MCDLFLSLSLSLQHTGMVLVSYYQMDNAITSSSDPDGVVLMWDLKFKKDTPDFIFNCYVSIDVYTSIASFLSLLPLPVESCDVGHV